MIMQYRAFLALALALMILPVISQSPYAQNSPIVRTNPLPAGLQNHGAAVAGDYLYVIGGQATQTYSGSTQNESGTTRVVYKAPIRPDGQIGQWTPDRPIPQIRGYIANSTVVLNDVIYVVGGTDGMEDIGKQGRKYKTVLVSRPGQGGALEPWRESRPFPGPGLSVFTALATPGFIHVIGGNTQDYTVSKKVLTGVVGGDSMIQSWETGPDLPFPLWFHHSATVGGRVYVWGGLPTKESTPTSIYVLSSPILASGRLGRWEREAGTLPVGIYRGANAVAGPYLMTFCPSYEGGKISSDIVYTSLTSRGLEPWQRMQFNLPMKVYTTCAPDYRRGIIYVPGGAKGREVNSDVAKDVLFFRLTQEAKQYVRGTVSETVASNTVEIPDSAGLENGEFTFATQDQLPGDALPGFLPYEVARRELSKSRDRPLIAYFHMSAAKPSQDQVSRLRDDPQLKELTDKALMAWIDVKSSPQLASQVGIFRVPTWVLYTRDGFEQGRASDILTVPQLLAGVDASQ